MHTDASDYPILGFSGVAFHTTIAGFPILVNYTGA